MWELNDHKSAGFSLLEVLVALVVLSIGMLGISGLYVQSMLASRTALHRHQAVNLMGDIADRVRANPTARDAYQHASSDLGSNNNCVARGINCNAAEMAAHDIFLWQDQARTTLPRGTVAIDFAAAAVDVRPSYRISISWDSPGTTPFGAPPSFVVTIAVRPI